jgi:ABC-type proline/glycine betaine transport system permease subunit
MSGFVAVGAALLSVGLVIAVLGFARNPALRLGALAIFAVPAAIAGYGLVYGVTKNAIDSTVALNLLSGAGGLFIGIAAMLNLNALGTAVLSR